MRCTCLNVFRLELHQELAELGVACSHIVEKGDLIVLLEESRAMATAAGVDIVALSTDHKPVLLSQLTTVHSFPSHNSLLWCLYFILRKKGCASGAAANSKGWRDGDNYSGVLV
eukprot:SAG31_NODE_517_length_14689_cov_5.110487_7_plen_114_part_00